MNVIKTEIPDVSILKPEASGGERGFPMESFSQKVFEKAIGYKVEFVQDSHSKSIKGVLRGLHYQLEPYAQGRSVRCVVGEIFDVTVDIRRSSGTSGKWVGVNLSTENKHQLWIPEGFAYEFLILSDLAEVLYKTNQHYAPSHERDIIWNGPLLNIKRPRTALITLSDKDANGEKLELGEYRNVSPRA